MISIGALTRPWSSSQHSLDDGADLIVRVHGERSEYAEGVLGGTEETTTGVHRLLEQWLLLVTSSRSCHRRQRCCNQVGL